MTNKTYTASEFVKAMQAGELVEPTVIYGFVKESSDDACLSIALDAVCSNWCSVPMSLIESISFIGMQQCEDHEHPVVEIYLKSDSENAENLALLKLLRTMNSSRNMPNTTFNSDNQELAGSGFEDTVEEYFGETERSVDQKPYPSLARCPANGGTIYDPNRQCCCRRMGPNGYIYTVKTKRRPSCNCTATCLGVNGC